MSRPVHTSIDVSRLLAASVVDSVEYHASLTSTNDHARLITEQSSPAPPVDHWTLVIAEEQTAGRGRGANRWWTGRGSLAFSLLFDPQVVGIQRRYTTMIPLAAAIAICDTVAPHLNLPSPLVGEGPGVRGSRSAEGNQPGCISQRTAKDAGQSAFSQPEASARVAAGSSSLTRRVGMHGKECRLGIHWPNDVYVADRKLAGILVEGLADGRQIVGIGLNVNNSSLDAPPELASLVTTVAELAGCSIDRTELLIQLLRNLRRLFEQLGEAPTSIGRRANELCLQHGQSLTVRAGERETRGICNGIADDGALLLETPSGLQTIYSGVLVKAPLPLGEGGGAAAG